MDFSENMRNRGISTIIAKCIGCDTLKLSLADKWTSGISLQKETEDGKTENVSSEIKTLFLTFAFSVFHANHLHLANSSPVFGELGAEHVLTVEVLLPHILALMLELQFLSGLLENR